VRELCNAQFIDGEAYWNRIEWIIADVSDLCALETAMEGVDTVYHCAGLISFDPADRDKLLKVNWEGTRNMINTALDKNVRAFCFASSIATVGSGEGSFDETHLWDPSQTNIYATSKYLGEMEVWRGGLEGLETVIVNPGLILGPGFWNRGSGRLFTAVAKGLKRYPPGGTGFVGIADVVRGMIGLMHNGSYNRRYIMVAENLSYREALQAIAQNLGVAPPRKQLRQWQLETLWRLDWLRSKLAGSPRKLSKETARGLRRQKQFENNRIKEELGLVFTPVDEVIEQCAKAFTGTSLTHRPAASGS
jgi:nucleoside-diphosphate-sugar epimerase